MLSEACDFQHATSPSLSWVLKDSQAIAPKVGCQCFSAEDVIQAVTSLYSIKKNPNNLKTSGEFKFNTEHSSKFFFNTKHLSFDAWGVGRSQHTL